MTVSTESLKKWIEEMAALINNDQDPEPQYYNHFIQKPELALQLVELIGSLNESDLDEDRGYYSACLFALDICVAQLQTASETGHKLADKTLHQLMSTIAIAIQQNTHSLSFWLPILNAFYEVHVELSDELKSAYLYLANEEELTPEEEISHLNSIRDLILELSDLSVFEIAENFFAQSYAMPAEFFADLLFDLYSIEEGQDIALLALLHPKSEVRDIVVATLDQLLPSITLSSESLSRLRVIKHWYPVEYHAQFDYWIKQQRKKEVIFSVDTPAKIIQLKASEVDGSGAQGVFIHLRQNRKNRLCGLLFKEGVGIKDAWITPVITAADVVRYYDEAFNDSVMLREVDIPYLEMMANHFLAQTIEHGGMPDLHLLEMQEILGVHFIPRALDIPYLLEQLGVQISPFTPDSLHASLKRSKTWPKNKRFTESWFVENAHIDKLVNRCCNFVDGVRICRINEAMDEVFVQEMELHRERWLFHFIWIALWMKVKARKNEKIWQDSFFIAYAIHTGTPLHSIPIMHEICQQSVINSVETMQERRTHLTKE